MQENAGLFCGETVLMPENFVEQDKADFRGCVARISRTLDRQFFEGMEEFIPIKECACELPLSPEVLLELKRLCDRHGYIFEHDPHSKVFKVSWPVGQLKVHALHEHE